MRRGNARALALVATSAGLGAGVFMVAWHAESLRLEPGGVNLAWPTVLALGVAWGKRDAMMWRTGAGLALGACAAIAGFYLALQFLPITPLGVAIGVGLSAVVVAGASMATRGWLPFGASVAGFAVGVASSQMTNISATTGASDVVATGSAVIFALLAGVLGSRVLWTVRDIATRRTQPEALPPPREHDAEALVIDALAPASSRGGRR